MRHIRQLARGCFLREILFEFSKYILALLNNNLIYTDNICKFTRQLNIILINDIEFYDFQKHFESNSYNKQIA